MPRVPVVPIPDLAVAFLEAVAEGAYPVQQMAQRFDLTPEQASARSWRLRKSGWLPPGGYTEPGWLELAQAMVDERLDALMERELRQRSQLAARVRRAHAAVERERREAVRAQVPAQVKLRSVPTAPRTGRRESVLDLFG